MHFEFSNLRNLVIVAGHAVYTGTDFETPSEDKNWWLQEFQKGEPAAYLKLTDQILETIENTFCKQSKEEQ